MLKKLEEHLEQKGFSPDARRAIRNAKICIIDDQIQDLRSFTDGLKGEGFTNIVELGRVESLSHILDEQYDLIVLDLAGVAPDVFKEDGVGVLAAIKRSEPHLPVLVLSGTRPPPDMVKTLGVADLIRNKPVMPGDLSADVEQLLRTRKDPFWAALSVLKELHRLRPDLPGKLGWYDRMRLWYLQKKMAGGIENADPNVKKYLLRVAPIVVKLGETAVGIIKLAQGWS